MKNTESLNLAEALIVSVLATAGLALLCVGFLIYKIYNKLKTC
jgi:hypothetical protein